MQAKDADKNGQIVRLFSRDGHVGSLLPCGVNGDGTVNCWDLAKPNGEVIQCGISNELVDSFAELLGWESL